MTRNGRDPADSSTSGPVDQRATQGTLLTGTAPDRGTRGTATTLGFALSIVVATLLVSGLFIAGGSITDSEQQQVVRTELRVVGQTIAAELTTADRLAVTTNRTVRVERSVPRRAGGVPFDVRLTGAGPGQYELLLSTDDPDVRVTVGFASRTPVVEGTFGGGAIVVQYVDTDADPALDELEVTNG